MKIYNFLILLLLASCSLLETENEKTVKAKTYSSETDRYFESIEKTQVGDLYLKNSLQKNQSEKNQPEKGIQNQEYLGGNLSSLKKPHLTTVKEVKLKGHPQLKRELNQILSFHCMKHRKRFAHESECINAVNQVIVSCEKSHSEVKPPFVKCLKSKLKNI